MTRQACPRDEPAKTTAPSPSPPARWPGFAGFAEVAAPRTRGEPAPDGTALPRKLPPPENQSRNQGLPARMKTQPQADAADARPAARIPGPSAGSIPRVQSPG